jgi:transposase
VLKVDNISNLSPKEKDGYLVEILELNEKLQEINKKQGEQIEWLKENYSQLQRMLFGVKSERFIPSRSNQPQLGLFPGETEEPSRQQSEEVETVVKKKKKRKTDRTNHNGRQLLQNATHIKRIRRVIEPDIDTSGMVCIGEEVTEKLCYRKAELYIEQWVRSKYVDKEQSSTIQDAVGEKQEQKGTSKIYIGDLPDFTFPQVIADVSLIVYLMISKFCDHLPEHRIIEIFTRQNLKIPPSTMNGWMHRGIRLLLPLYEALKKDVLASKYLQVDETTIRVMEKLKKDDWSVRKYAKGTAQEKIRGIFDKRVGSHLGFYWSYHAPVIKALFFDYQKGRDHSGPMMLLEHFIGYLQSDAYQVYDMIEQEYDSIQLIHCMAHARRYFERALTSDKAKATFVLEKIQSLYRVERIIREYKLSDERIGKLRQQYSKPIIRKLKEWLDEQVLTALPKSYIGKAILYAHKRWDKLSAYLDNPILQIDNNLVENKIRPIAIGRKNYLFCGSHRSAQAAAMMYSLMGTCRLNGVNPQEWLTDVFNRIQDHDINKIHELLPYNWEKQTDS